MEKRFNYTVLDDLKYIEDTPVGFSLGIELDKKFIEFAKKQRINPEQYESFGREVIHGCFESWALKEVEISRGIYIWEKPGFGLLKSINMPGQETYLDLEKMPGDIYRYCCHNIDGTNQHSALLILMNYWLRQMQLRDK